MIRCFTEGLAYNKFNNNSICKFCILKLYIFENQQLIFKTQKWCYDNQQNGIQHNDTQLCFCETEQRQ
jgi:hypothetical protein